MCGICGFIKLKPDARNISYENIELMCNHMILRGPDGGGIWINEDYSCGLGHRRLSIIDLSNNASQPMKNGDGSIIVTFNGEIYNHAEIRKKLERDAHYNWKTDHSDTEVIIHAYEEWGIDCVDRFRGCFAFAIWDGRNKTLFLVRDRLGIKPLYYCVEGETLIFASEIKAILPLLKSRPKMNERAVYDYLTYLCVPGEETLFTGIYKLPPATIVQIRHGTKEFFKYWDVWENTRPEVKEMSDKDIHKELVKELKTSVGYRKVSDVPVGIFLSGGVDSSINCKLFSLDHHAPISAFCIGYSDASSEYKNENEFARKVARECKAEFYEKYLTEQDWISFIPEMIRLQDEPIADPTCVPSYYVSKLARENGIIVAQVGEGADELFIGYDLWLKIHQLDLVNTTFDWEFPKKIINNIVDRNKRYRLTLPAEILRRSLKREPLFYSGAEFFYEKEKRLIMSHDFNEVIGDMDSFSSIRPIYERFIDTAWEKSVLNWMSYIDLNVRLPELLLMRVDKMSMGVSLECRVPFLDHNVVELAMSIPSERKIKGNVTKRMLKDAVHELIPEEITNRKKQGFGIPIYSWMHKRLGKQMKASIIQFAHDTSIFNADAIIKNIDRFSGNQMWCLYNLSEWWNAYIRN